MPAPILATTVLQQETEQAQPAPAGWLRYRCRVTARTASQAAANG